MKIDTNLIAKSIKSAIGNSSSHFRRKETLVGRFARTSLLLLFVLCSAMASAEQVQVTLTEAGTLPEKIASDQKYTITSLKVSGPINGTDVRYLREMAGMDAKGYSTAGKLADLDLTDASIVEGGECYYRNYYAKNDTLGDYMFYGCGLTSVKIPNSVTRIGENAFCHCQSLTSVTIPNSVTSISYGAFSDCSSLTSITIPNSVKSIGERAFSLCQSLTSIAVEEGNTYYHMDSNCLIETASNKLIRGCNLTSVTIPNSVTSIGYGAFSDCSSLTSVTIPNYVTSIGSQAFSYCSSLTSVTIGNSVASIGYGAFSSCRSLTSVTIPNSVTSIGFGAFEDCLSLTSIDIPNSVTSIGSYAFNFCISLTSVTIPNSVTSIGDCAFQDCSSLTSVTIGNSVASISYLAFKDCTALVKLVSLNTTPPTCRDNSLADIDKDSCTLYVPKNSLEAYKAADQWKDFKNMEKIDPTGISLPDSNGNNKVVKRYDTNGRMTDKPFKGLNILKMGDGTTRKVMVK